MTNASRPYSEGAVVSRESRTESDSDSETGIAGVTGDTWSLSIPPDEPDDVGKHQSRLVWREIIDSLSEHEMRTRDLDPTTVSLEALKRVAEQSISILLRQRGVRGSGV